MQPINQITSNILQVSFRIHSELGPGLFESVYEAVMAHNLTQRGFHVERQKSVAKLAPVHSKQLLTYLRLLKCPVGLLLNFGAHHLKDGINRIANGPLEKYMSSTVPPVSSV